MTTYVRADPADEDPERLLNPERQRSRPWGGTVYGRCDKCAGSGVTEHRCASCEQGGADPACPVCAGEVRYTDTCPACEGNGEIDDSERRGVSVFPGEEGLYSYLGRRGADISDAVLVELEGEPSDDDDFDADDGALLVHPTRIVDQRPLDPERLRGG